MFRLDSSGCLSYFENDTLKLKGTIYLEGASVRLLKPSEANSREYAFEIFNLNSKNKKMSLSLMLAGRSMEEVDDWVTVITNYTNQSTRSQFNDSARISRNISGDFGSSSMKFEGKLVLYTPINSNLFNY